MRTDTFECDSLECFSHASFNPNRTRSLTLPVCSMCSRQGWRRPERPFDPTPPHNTSSTITSALWSDHSQCVVFVRRHVSRITQPQNDRLICDEFFIDHHHIPFASVRINHESGFCYFVIRLKRGVCSANQLSEINLCLIYVWSVTLLASMFRQFVRHENLETRCIAICIYWQGYIVFEYFRSSANCFIVISMGHHLAKRLHLSALFRMMWILNQTYFIIIY